MVSGANMTQPVGLNKRCRKTEEWGKYESTPPAAVREPASLETSISLCFALGKLSQLQ